MSHPYFQITNLTRPLQSPLQAHHCVSFLCRLRGLTFRSHLGESEALLLAQQRQNRMDAAIHMLFVFMDLAVIWVDSDCKVVDTQLALRWRPFYIPQSPAKYVLEASPNRLSEFQIGDQLSFEEITLD